jgi:hypothetical protein
VVDRRGRLVKEIRLRGHGRILALDANAALVSEPTRDGVRLLAVALPEALTP